MQMIQGEPGTVENKPRLADLSSSFKPDQKNYIGAQNRSGWDCKSSLQRILPLVANEHDDHVGVGMLAGIL